MSVLKVAASSFYVHFQVNVNKSSVKQQGVEGLTYFKVFYERDF